MSTNLTQHPCSNKCSNFKDEQCAQCLIEQLDKREFELGLAPDDAYVKTVEDFIAGDVVVFIDNAKTDRLMTVHKVQGNGVLLDGNRNFALAHLIRHANVAVLNAKRRLLEEYWIDSNGKKWKTPQIKGRLKSRIPSHFALREFVIERDGYKCQHCGSMDRKKLVADHILSRRNGGSHHPSNLQCLCDSCNARKAGLVDSKVTSNG